MKKKAQKTQVEYEIVRFLSQGAYNCAHVITDNGEEQVLRVALMPKDEENTYSNMMVKRGIQIVNVFQDYKNMLGPSLIIEKADFEFRAVTLKQLKLNRELLCATIVELAKELDEDNTPYEFAIQVIELLKGGSFTRAAYEKMTPEEHMFSMFSLLWFFYNTHARFDFRHHDLKGDNIIMRQYAEPMTFTFAITDRQFVFTSRYVPVVIDYDFASVLTTKDSEARNTNGTPYTGSPDATLRHVMGMLTGATPSEEAEDVAGAYDWWSLGIVLLEFFLPNTFGTFDKQSPGRGKPDVPVLFLAERAAYASDVFERLPKRKGVSEKEFVQQAMYIPLGCVIACLVADGYTLVPPAECSAYVQRDVFFHPKFLNDILETEQYETLRAEYMRLSQGVRDILRMLLSWYPERRSYLTRSYMYLYESCFRQYEDIDHELGDFHYDCDVKGWLEDSGTYQRAISATTYPLLEACISCGATSNMSACVCCDLLFCSTACQDEKH